MYGHVSCCRTCIILGQRQFLPHVVVFLHTRTSGTRLQTTVMQVSRVRRGATQRDYRLLYYKFCRFAAREIWHGRIWNDWYGVPQFCGCTITTICCGSRCYGLFRMIYCSGQYLVPANRQDSLSLGPLRPGAIFGPMFKQDF